MVCNVFIDVEKANPHTVKCLKDTYQVSTAYVFFKLWKKKSDKSFKSQTKHAGKSDADDVSCFNEWIELCKVRLSKYSFQVRRTRVLKSQNFYIYVNEKDK